MGETIKTRIGGYVCRVGYLDIRQRTAYKKATEVFVVHSKNIVAGPYKSVSEARKEAERCVNEGIKHVKNRK